MGQMGIKLQLADVIYPCSEGWWGPQLASSVRYAMLKELLRLVTGGIVRVSVSFRGK